MKKELLALAMGLAGLVAGHAVQAADVPRPLTKAPPSMAVDWTGAYAGVQGGGGWGKAAQTDLTGFNTGWYDLSGGIAGITWGYNWQVGKAVIGFESDVAWTNIRGSSDGAAAFNGPCGGATPRCETKLQYLGTTRLRLGYAMGRFLPYVTGGMATGYLHGVEGDIPANGGAAGSGSQFHFGWTAGGGVEAIIDAHWSAKVEYLYVDLRDGKVFVNQFDTGNSAPQWIASRFNVVRFGLNYRFAPGPNVLPVLPSNPGPGGGPWTWSGFYAGIHYGGGAGTASQSDGFFDRGRYDVGGSLVGGTVGFNWQRERWVFGMEGDIGYSTIRGATGGTQDFTNPPCGFGITYANCETRLTWLATMRGRIGYGWDRLLPYVTAGLAVGSLRSSEGDGVMPFSGSGTVTRGGWTAGGGIEARIDQRWSAKLEYLYVDLGSGEGFVDTYPGGLRISQDVSFRTNIVRGGLNYRFN